MTLVIAPGYRERAFKRAFRLAHEAAGDSFDYWLDGGRFGGALKELGLVPEADDLPETLPASRLPSPLPDLLIPHAVVTPKGAFIWSPLDRAKRTEWPPRVNRLIDRHRGGHTIVILDGHC